MSGTPSLGRTVLRGMLLGVAADFLVCLTFVGLGVTFTYLQGGPREAGFGASVEQVVLLLGLAAFIVAFFPSIVWGGIIALILRRLSGRQKVASTAGIVVGAAIGFLAGLVTHLIVNLVAQTPGTDLVFGLMTAGIAAFVGGWHGWSMVRYLQRAGDRVEGQDGL
jgi:hypothetical protein